MQDTMEVSAALPADRVVLLIGHDVAHAPAELRFGYFPGEDRGRGAAPFKIAVQLGLNDYREFSLTRYQVAGIVQHWWRCLKLRAFAPNRKPDNNDNPHGS